MNLTTLRALAAVALHQTARTLHDVVRALRPTGVCIPADADVTVSTSPWFYTKSHNLVIEDQDEPVVVYPSQIATLLGVTVATTLDNGNDASDHSMVYVLLNTQNDPWALYGRDEDGYFLDGDLREVV